MKESIISLDGVDKTGNDTVCRDVEKQSKGKVLVLNRTFMSQIVYSRLYNRKINEDYFIEKMKEFRDIGVVFFELFASEKVLINRFNKHNEEDVEIDGIIRHLKAYADLTNELLTVHSLTVFPINTTVETADISAKRILKIINGRFYG